jgi:hypothetical protein
MSADHDVMPASQLARWAAVGILILAAVLIYFREGTRLPAIGPTSSAADTLSGPTPPAGR